MILIADSGSTKTDWILIDSATQSTVVEIQTIGLNPFFVSAEDLKTTIAESQLYDYKNKIKAIHFYGAGCSVSEKNTWLHNQFQVIFSHAAISIKTDIEGAVIALSDNKPSIVCILGTGSTFRVYDGQNIIKKYSSLAYILGDEGSGTHISKALLRKVFYKQLPHDLEAAFFKQFPITKDELLENVYQKPFPNRHLAQFTRFCSKNIEHPIIEKIVLDSLENFAENHLVRLEEIKEYPVHFVGSIAHHFSPQLKKIAQKMNFAIGKIEQKPLSLLKEFHCNKKESYFC